MCAHCPISDLSDNERDSTAQAPSSQVQNSDSHQQAINYTSLAATAAAVAASGVKSNVTEQEQQQSISSTETLLRNIQSLLTVAADNARQQERQISYEKGTSPAHNVYAAKLLCLSFFTCTKK